MIDKKELHELNIFESINESSMEMLSNVGVLSCYLKNSHIFREREVVDNIYIVFNGKVAIYKINEDGNKKVVFILNRGTFINEAQLDNLKSSVNCEAFENCEILSFNKEAFMRVMASDFKLTTIVINALAKKTRRMYRQLKNSTSINIKKKVAAKLWKFSNDYGVKIPEGTLIDLVMSVTYLSEMFGIPRETISRALKNLSEQNLIIQKNKKIIVVDKDMLAMYFKGLTKED
ncbi:MAG: Crp/Fnr family transcriptional regulator [Sarcina sp.]